MNKTNIILGILLIAALVGGLILVNQSQDMRRGAAFANTKLFLLPSEKIEKKVGETFDVQVWYTTTTDAKVEGVQANLCYGSAVSVLEDSVSVATEFSADNSIVKSANGCTTIVAVGKNSLTADQLKSNARAFTVTFRANSVGNGNITINQDKSAVSGNNSASSTDKTIAITEVAGTSYDITESGVTPINTDGATINFKVTMAGVGQAMKCADKWPVKVIVMGGGQTVVQNGVELNKTSETYNNLAVYQGSFKLGSGFNVSSGLAIFVKGQKHLQMKYGRNGQDATYGKAGGELTLSGDSTSFDFSKYTMLAGDVNQDGWINGQDFSQVKSKAEKYEQVAEGGNLLGDLDGSCQVNTRDTNLLVNSLDKKQEELY